MERSLDIFGELVADLDQGGVELTLQTIRGRADPGQDGYQAENYFRSTVNIKPNEIVEVALRQPDDKPGASAGRVFALRIQAKQLR